MISLKRKRNNTERLFPRTLWVFVLMFILLFLSISIFKYFNFLFEAYDLAIFNQAFWNTLHGAPFWITVTFPHSYLADHIGLWLVIILPVYAVFQHPITLLTLQTAAIGAAAFPIYLIARHLWDTSGIKIDKLSGASFGLGAAAIWLLNPFVHNFTLFEFHFLAFFPVFIFTAVYAYLKQNKLLFIISVIFAATTREDTGLAMSGLLIIILMDYFKNKIKTERKNILFFFITASTIVVLWTISAYLLIHLNSDFGGTRYVNHYSWLGANAAEALWTTLTQPTAFFQHLFSNPNINVFLAVLLPLIFLPLFRRRFILLSAVPLLAIFLLNDSIDHISTLKVQYTAVIIPGLLLATIEGFIAFSKKYSQQYTFLLILIIFISTTYTGVFFGPLIHGNLDSIKEKMTSRAETWSQVTQKHNNSAPSLASTYFLPNLSSAKYVYDASQIYGGKKEFTNLPYDLPCNVQNLFIDTNEIAHDTAASVLYNTGFESLENLQKTIDCSPIKNIVYKNDISIAMDIDQKTDVTSTTPNSGIELTEINVKPETDKIILNGRIFTSDDTDLKKVLFRAELFDDKKDKGLAVLFPLQKLAFSKQNDVDKNAFYVEINSPRFLAMFKDTGVLNFFVVENAGYATVKLFNIVENVAESPEIVYDSASYKND